MTDANAAHVTKVEAYERQAATLARTTVDSYAGLPIYASPGLHAHVLGLIQQRAPRGARVLELAAGTGAFTKRLMDHGYDVTPVDLVPKNFRAGGVECRQADFNTDFADAFERHDVVSASEIIEHVENPRHFLRQCARLVKPGGFIVVTTPNTESAASIVSWLRNGYDLWFSDHDYDDAGHITPVKSRQLLQMAAESKLKVDLMSSYGDAERLLTFKGRLLARALRRLSVGQHHGECLVAVLGPGWVS